MKKKNLLLSLCSAFAVVFCCLFLMQLSVKPAFADEQASSPVSTFAMDGASVRYPADDDNVTGMRFVAKITAEQFDSLKTEKGTALQAGIIMLPNALLGENELTLSTSKAKVADLTDKYFEVTKNGTEYYEFRCYLYDMPAANYNTFVSARCYITDGENIYYTDTISRSMTSVAQAAINDADVSEDKKQPLNAYITGQEASYTIETYLETDAGYQLLNSRTNSAAVNSSVSVNPDLNVSDYSVNNEKSKEITHVMADGSSVLKVYHDYSGEPTLGTEHDYIVTQTTLDNVFSFNDSGTFSGAWVTDNEDNIALSSTLSEGANDIQYSKIGDKYIYGGGTVNASFKITPNGAPEGFSALTVYSAKLNVTVPSDEIERRLSLECGDSAKDSGSYSVAIDYETYHEGSGSSSLKYTFDKTNGARATFIRDAAGELFKATGASVTNWNNAYIGFYIKNADCDLNNITLRFHTINNGVTYGTNDYHFTSYLANIANKKSDEWVYKEFSLFEVASNLSQSFSGENVEGFYFGLSAEIGSSCSFYIDDITLFSREDMDATDIYLASSGAIENRNCITEVNTDKDYVKEGNSSLKVNFKSGYNDTTTNRGFVKYMRRLEDRDYIFGLTSDSFAAGKDLYVGFWYKQTEKIYESETKETQVSFRIGMQNSQDGTWKGVSDVFSYDGQRSVQNVTDWQYVEVKVADVLSACSATMYTENVKYYFVSLSFEINYNTDVVFYIDDMTVSNESRLDKIETLSLPASGGRNPSQYKIETNLDSEYVKEGKSSLKCTFTYKSNRSTILYYEGTVDSDDIFGVTSDMFSADKHLYVGFWIKQDAVLTKNACILAELQNTQDGTTYQGTMINFPGYRGNENIVNDTNWHYMEFDITHMIEYYSNEANYSESQKGYAQYYKALYTENVTKYRVSITTEVNVEGDTVFYIDGISIYTKDATTSD